MVLLLSIGGHRESEDLPLEVTLGQILDFQRSIAKRTLQTFDLYQCNMTTSGALDFDAPNCGSALDILNV